MNQYKITYWNPKSGYRTVIIEAATKSEASREFMDLIVEGHSVGHCKTEKV
ncbi:hypothetical protein [Paenibacillus rhizosphaerae]|uniref:hypothetical protein n=1 Tax=Paenibacillus rhizosphaerae TaxID=297318 RepID=UPI00142D27B6|nr:hypothetical protein [Paenibacillus rhizosphaerae]